jgi:hypothetical protein
MEINYRFGRNPIAFSITEALGIMNDDDKAKLTRKLEENAPIYEVDMYHPAFSVWCDMTDDGYIFTAFVVDFTELEKDTDIRASRLQKAASSSLEVA